MTDMTEPLNGPDELVRDLVSEGCDLALGEPSLRALFRIAFVTSLQPEEKRYPRFMLYVAAASPGREHPTLVRFDPPLPLTSDLLHRLGPSVPPRPLALEVGKDDTSRLIARSIVRLEWSGLSRGTGPNDASRGVELVSGSQLPGLILELAGPGRLIASNTTSRGNLLQFHELNSGRVRRAADATYCYPSIAVTHGAARCRGVAPPIITWLWGALIREVVALQHGGTLAVLPPEKPAGLESVLSVHVSTTGSDLGLAARRVEQEGSQDAITAAMDVVRTVACATAPDGCVVLSHALAMQGFMGEIRGHSDVFPQCRLMHPGFAHLRETGEDFDLRHFGMRHRSAARLASSLGEGGFVFVVSQDGGVRVFCGIANGRVGVYGPLRVNPGLSPPP